jgi:alpha-beta hydrolase superfamily lysophospholipase
MPSNAHANPHPEIGTELIREWVPQREPKAYIVLVHGMGEHSGRYEEFGSQLADAGFQTRSFDMIGAGGSGGARWDIDEWSRFHDQIQRHIEWARGFDRPVVLMGFSFGGNLSLGYALSDRPAPDLLVLSAPALDGGAAWLRAVAPVAARIAPRFEFPNPWKGEHLSRDPAVGDKYYADPLVHTKSTLRFGSQFLAAMEECNEHIDELAIPTLVVHGGDDRLVPTDCSAPLGDLDVVERKVYDGLRHEVINEPEGPQVTADIISWLDGQIAGL